MNIQNFRTSINTKGVLRNNRFIARIVFPYNHYLYNRYNQSQELYSIRCESINLPGVSLASADGPPTLGYGPIEKRPYNANFEDITLTFIIDSASQIHKMFYDWANCIVNYKSQGLKNLFNKDSLFGESPTIENPIETKDYKGVAYEVGYKNRYGVDLLIDVYKDTGTAQQTSFLPDNSMIIPDNPAMSVKLYNAFPMALPAVSLGWDQGDIIKLAVPFAYTDYTVKYNVK